MSTAFQYDIYLAIERGLEAARVQVLCLSPAALGSEWVALERSTVLFRDPTNQGRRFISFLLADAKWERCRFFARLGTRQTAVHCAISTP